VEGGLTYTQTFDAENRLISVTVNSQTTQFIYDGDGNLVKKVKPDGSKTIYVGGVYEVDKTSGGAVTRTISYYPVAGAMRINSTLYYVLKDHLGSASAVTDASGNTVGEQRYYPFGETRLSTGSMFTDKLFTGQREMAGLGVYHFNARFYSPKLGRFLSADTIVPGYTNPQNLNRFSYVRNNPLRYIDPSGHVITDPVGCHVRGCPDPAPAPSPRDPDPEPEPRPEPDPDPTPPVVPTPPIVTTPPPPNSTVTPPLYTTTTVISTGTPPSSFTQGSSEPSSCPSCVIRGGAIIIAAGALEGIFAAAGVMAVSLSGPAAIPGVALVVLPIEVVLVNVTLIGIEYVIQGENRSPDEIDIDYLPLLHLVTNPDEGVYFK
jgi:RHS repeat-associated protein